jgi:hypothetical protein
MTAWNHRAGPGVPSFEMRSRLGQASAIVSLALACTAAPAALPRGGAPPRCEFAGIGTNPSSAAPGAVLGRFWVRATDSDELAWVDPVTLQRTSRSSGPIAQTGPYAVSPNGKLVAVLSHGVAIIDTRTLDPVATIHRNRGEGPQIFAWLSDRVLAGITDTSAVLWNARGQVLRNFGLGTKVPIVAWHAATDRLIALVTPSSEAAGASRLIAITNTGVNTIQLPRVRAGYDPVLGEHGTQLIPGLAYDPVDHRVFVIQPDGPIAEVALDEKTVSYHDPTTSFIGAVSDALLPMASAKLGGWFQRQAIWLGSGIVATSGSDGHLGGGRSEPVGVALIDTRDWRTCSLDDRATHIAVTGGVLLAWGGPNFREFGGVGLLGWKVDDGTRWHLFGRQDVDVQMWGRYAYATNSWHGWDVSTVEVSKARVIAELDHRPPTALPKGSSTQNS